VTLGELDSSRNKCDLRGTDAPLTKGSPSRIEATGKRVKGDFRMGGLDGNK